LAVNPHNGQEIYYASNDVWYRTADGGEQWTAKRLPVTKAATALLVDFFDQRVLYLGSARLDK